MSDSQQRNHRAHRHNPSGHPAEPSAPQTPARAADADHGVPGTPRSAPRIVPVRAADLPAMDGPIISRGPQEFAVRASPRPAHDFATRANPAADLGPVAPHGYAGHLSRAATVLIVEHEFNNRKLMESILDLGGYRCVSASNGQEALVMFERELPDLMLTDVSMPIMDGLATTAALRARPDGKHIPIIAVSGHALREDREHALRQGCTEYLVKPFRPRDLLSLVERLLRA